MAVAIKRSGNFFELTGIDADVTMEQIFQTSQPFRFRNLLQNALGAILILELFL